MPTPNPSLITNYPNGVSSFGTTQLSSLYAQLINTTPAVNLLGASPVGFSGTLDALQIINGDTTKGTLIFAKNGTNFATLIKNGTAGAITGTPIQNSVTFTPTDTLTVSSVGTDVTEVIAIFH